MYKRIFGIVWLFLFLFSSACTFMGEKEKEDSKEASSINIEIKKEPLYKVELTEEGEIVILALTEDKESLVRKEKVSPLRKKDEEILKEGILTKNLEEALMIFEDFIS